MQTDRILARSFFTTFRGVFHFDLRISSPNSVQMFLHIISATWLFHARCTYSILHPAFLCWFATGACSGCTLDLAWCGRSQLWLLLYSVFLCCHDQRLCAVFQYMYVCVCVCVKYEMLCTLATINFVYGNWNPWTPKTCKLTSSSRLILLAEMPGTCNSE